MEAVIEKKKVNNKYIFLEVLRIIACLFVTINHTISGVADMADTPLVWGTATFLYRFSRSSVAIFVMISGYLLLDRRDGYKKSWMRALRVVIALFLFSFMWYYYQHIMWGRPNFGFEDYFICVMTTPMAISYWYMYMYIGLLLMMPFLQRFVAALSKRDCQILIGITMFITAVFPVMQIFFPSWSLSGYFEFAIFDTYVGMLLIGYYFKKYIEPSRREFFFWLGGLLLCFVVNILLLRMQYYTGAEWIGLMFGQSYYLTVSVTGICIFGVVRHLSMDGMVAKVIKLIAGCTFGVYFLADMLTVRGSLMYNSWVTEGAHPLPAMIVFDFWVFFVGVAITLVLKQIPLLKKII